MSMYRYFSIHYGVPCECIENFVYALWGTVNVEIFTLYIFLRYLRFLDVRENMYHVKITFIMPCKGNIVKNVKLSIFAKIYTRKNIYIHNTLRPCI